MMDNNDLYSQLSLQEKADLFKIYAANGYTSLDSIKEHYNRFVEGGSIHIKPENRGKFTALKERTGHSATWFKENGTPAQKKMATFALNARKWKHDDGGYLDNLTIKPFSYSPIPQVRYGDGGKKSTVRRVNFKKFAEDVSNNDGRYVPIKELEQLQDSLITRGYHEPQRLATLATSAQEMGREGAASRGIGGNGYLGLSSGRMPTSLLSNTPEGRGAQIKYVLDDLEHVYTGTHPQAGNWNDGGTGGPKIMSGKDGSTQFWNAADEDTAIQVLNKSYIRPAGGVKEWQRRAKVAKNMSKYLE